MDEFAELINRPETRFRMREAILARRATDDDDPSDVLLVGPDFRYLAQDRTGKLVRVSVGDERLGAPERIVIDADSFLAGMAAPAQRDESSPPQVGELIAVHETDGRLFRVQIAPVALT
ncbi:hypothetical protein QE430_002449 [Microbacterium testaceum]|uniref:hypothetical protein n=1 Tax=Microbacterium testaceum TaxID=2033 RepID=UPI0027873118|nr:hypothetical protein [Microbacterium testaceum]MDQ1174142.1 hypothetical protein [Microbacterium testaceum]